MFKFWNMLHVTFVIIKMRWQIDLQIEKMDLRTMIYLKEEKFTNNNRIYCINFIIVSVQTIFYYEQCFSVETIGSCSSDATINHQLHGLTMNLAGDTSNRPFRLRLLLSILGKTLKNCSKNNV